MMTPLDVFATRYHRMQRRAQTATVEHLQGHREPHMPKPDEDNKSKCPCDPHRHASRNLEEASCRARLVSADVFQSQCE